MIRMQTLIAAIVLSLPGVASAGDRPNIVVLLVDDAGFMDFGGYGGEATTPNIDRLAEDGVRFSNYHTSPLCSPSRAMLLTGRDNHRAGMGTIPEVLRPEQEGRPGYEMRLLPEADTIAELLRGAGYQTFMTGKWHLGRGPGDLPDDHGFDRSFALDASGADNWQQKPYMPFYDEAPWFEDGKPATLPEDFYSSQFLIDRMISYLETRDRAAPFFAYVAFQAIHIPVQAPRAFSERYRGVYADGWHATRARRIARAKELGLFPGDAPEPQAHPSLREWETLGEEEKAHYEANMMVNAGMLEAMDHHIGRLIAYLEASGELENTVFVVTSDNGPEFADPTADRAFRVWMAFNGYHTDLDRLGEKGFMGAIGPEWASAAAAPGALFKMYASEGGTRVPLIVSGPGVARQGFQEARAFVADIAPTLAEMAGIDAAPGMDGRSLLPVLAGTAREVYGVDEPVGLEVAGNAALFKGRYKLTRNTRPHGDAQWRLHDLSRDPGETRDLSDELPVLRAAMLGDYERFAAERGIVALPAGFDIAEQITINTRAKMLSRALPGLLGGLAVIIAIAAGIWLVRRRRHGAARRQPPPVSTCRP